MWKRERGGRGKGSVSRALRARADVLFWSRFSLSRLKCSHSSVVNLGRSTDVDKGGHSPDQWHDACQLRPPHRLPSLRARKQGHEARRETRQIRREASHPFGISRLAKLWDKRITFSSVVMWANIGAAIVGWGSRLDGTQMSLISSHPCRLDASHCSSARRRASGHDFAAVIQSDRNKVWRDAAWDRARKAKHSSIT